MHEDQVIPRFLKLFANLLVQAARIEVTHARWHRRWKARNHMRHCGSRVDLTDKEFFTIFSQRLALCPFLV